MTDSTVMKQTVKLRAVGQTVKLRAVGQTMKLRAVGQTAKLRALLFARSAAAVMEALQQGTSNCEMMGLSYCLKFKSCLG